MAQAVSTFIIGRSVLAGLTLTAALLAGLVATDNASAQDREPAPEKSLYERLGGVFAIAAVVKSLQRRRREEPRRWPEV